VNKTSQYEQLLLQVEGLLVGESNLVSALANVSAALHFELGHWWTGFYLVAEKQLVLGPFQGPVACTRINYGKGVCGTAWQKQETIIVPNVHEFEGHIACSSESNSEIVVPIYSASDKIVGVLDIDSKDFNSFDEADQNGLERIAELLGKTLWK
jgi:GAF domain-containing protein